MRRAITFFGFVLSAALSLSTIFAVLITSYGHVPADTQEFVTTTILIATCVAAPMGALAAQNQFRVDRYNMTLRAMAPVRTFCSHLHHPSDRAPKALRGGGARAGSRCSRAFQVGPERLALMAVRRPAFA